MLSITGKNDLRIPLDFKFGPNSQTFDLTTGLIKCLQSMGTSRDPHEKRA